MKREPRQAHLNPPRSAITLLGASGYPTSLDCHQGKLAGDEEGVHYQEERDERQTDDGVNGLTLWVSLSERLTVENLSHPAYSFVARRSMC